MNQYHAVLGELIDAIWRGVLIGIQIVIVIAILTAALFAFVRVTPKVAPVPTFEAHQAATDGDSVEGSR